MPTTKRPPWTVRRTTFEGRPAELLTFTGTTEEEFDAFLDFRFEGDTAPIGWRDDAAAPRVTLSNGRLVWTQYRRRPAERGPE